MTTLKNLKGTAIQFLAEDPVVYAGSWSSGGSLNTGKASTLGTATGSSNAFVAGGYRAGSPNSTASTESYNGTSWTEVADIPATFNYGNGFGTNTAAIFAGADPTSVTTYVWNGSSWATPGNNLNTNRFIGGTAGTSTAGSIFGGGEPAASAKQEQWDGTSWTETTDMNTAKKNCFTGTGIQTASMCIGFPSPPFTSEVWNGSSWTEIAELNTQRGTGSGAGTTTAALFSGGQSPGLVANTEQYNGTSWTELSDLSLARSYIGNGGSGSSTATTDAIVYGGLTTVGVTNTEEWSFPPATSSTLQEGDMWFNSSSSALKGYALSVPGGTWAAGGSLNTAKYQLGTAGTQTATLAFGGSTPPYTATNESYNGTSWTELADLNAGRDGLGSAGTQTAALGFGGQNPGGATLAITESWNGSSWTEVNDLNSGRRFMNGTGNSNTAALCLGGYDGSNRAYVENWDGSSWTEIADLNTARAYIAGVGTPEAALAISGASGTNVEQWNGSSWTEVAEYNNPRGQGAASGTTSTNALFFGGEPGPEGAKTEIWNGSSWTELADLALSRSGLGGRGSTVAAIAIGGQIDPKSGTEEWTAPAAVVTVTTSQLTL